VIERGLAVEFREMKDNDYRSENVLPVLSKICVALKETTANKSISERFWSQLSQAILTALKAT
jgi:hypothetical protein